MGREFLQSFEFVLKYKYGKLNQVENALNWSYALINAMQIILVGFEMMKELYKDNLNFSYLWKTYSSGPKN